MKGCQFCHVMQNNESYILSYTHHFWHTYFLKKVQIITPKKDTNLSYIIFNILDK